MLLYHDWQVVTLITMHWPVFLNRSAVLSLSNCAIWDLWPMLRLLLSWFLSSSTCWFCQLRNCDWRLLLRWDSQARNVLALLWSFREHTGLGSKFCPAGDCKLHIGKREPGRESKKHQSAFPRISSCVQFKILQDCPSRWSRDWIKRKECCLVKTPGVDFPLQSYSPTSLLVLSRKSEMPKVKLALWAIYSHCFCNSVLKRMTRTQGGHDQTPLRR